PVRPAELRIHLAEIHVDVRHSPRREENRLPQLLHTVQAFDLHAVATTLRGHDADVSDELGVPEHPHRGFHPDPVGDFRTHHLLTEERRGRVVWREHSSERQTVVLATNGKGQLGGCVPLDQQDLGRGSTGQLSVKLDLVDEIGQVRQRVAEGPILIPVDQDFVEKLPLGAGDNGLSRFPSVRLHYASSIFKVTFRYGYLGDSVSSWSMSTIGAPPPTSKSVADSPASTWGAVKANVVSSGSLSVPITTENRQETAPAGGATASNARRAQVPVDRQNELDDVHGGPEAG